MRITNFLNPAYVLRRRERILPTFKRLAGDSLNRVGLPRDANEFRLRRLRNLHRGRRAFVIGNGPSLRMEDLDRLDREGEISFAANKIFLAFERTAWRPTYYGAEDILMFRESHNWTAIQSVSSVKLLPSYADRFVPRVPGAIYYRHAYEHRYPDLPYFSTDAFRHVWGGNTVLYIMLQFAYYMGIRLVYLLGVDSNYVTPKEVVSGMMSGPFPFYCVGDERNHFHPDYLRPGDIMGDPGVRYHRKSFEAAKLAFESDGRHIYNATRGGQLEILPRVDFDSLF